LKASSGAGKRQFNFFSKGFKSALNPTQQPHRTLYLSVKIKNKWSKTSICLHVKSRYNFNLEQAIKELDCVGGQSHAPAALSPGKKNITHCTGLWVDLRADLVRGGKILPPTGLDPRTFQPVTSRYSGYAIQNSWYFHIQGQAYPKLFTRHIFVRYDIFFTSHESTLWLF
jgi:hypothetical protein